MRKTTPMSISRMVRLGDDRVNPARLSYDLSPLPLSYPSTTAHSSLRALTRDIISSVNQLLTREAPKGDFINGPPTR